MTIVRLSQSHLNLLSICPPKFQQIYLDCLDTIPNLQQQEKMKWGSQFHLLMQQRELKLPIESLLTTDSELDAAFKALIKSAPELGLQNSDVWREAEHYRTLSCGNFVLTVIYDLLLAQTDRATILDWKTYRRPQNANQLARDWQTRLYLYVLSETSEYAPEQIQMTYWFVRSQQPQSVEIKYSQLLHQQTERDLNVLLTKLEMWLQDYQQNQNDFPHQPDCQAKCPYYQFFFQEVNEQESQQALWRAIDEIEEVSI